MAKRIISLLLSLVVMSTFVIPINAFADEEKRIHTLEMVMKLHIT